MDKNLPQINFRADDCDGQANLKINKSVDDDTTKFENQYINTSMKRSTRTNRREYKIEIKTKLAEDNTQAAAHTVDASDAKIRRHDTASWSAM